GRRARARRRGGGRSPQFERVLNRGQRGRGRILHSPRVARQVRLGSSPRYNRTVVRAGLPLGRSGAGVRHSRPPWDNGSTARTSDRRSVILSARAAERNRIGNPFLIIVNAQGHAV